MYRNTSKKSLKLGNFVRLHLTYSKQNKQFWVRRVFETETPTPVEGEIQGIDRGLYHQAVTSNGQFFSSSQIRAVQRRYLYNRRQLQQKGTRSAKRRLKAMSGCEKKIVCSQKTLCGHLLYQH
ncbi:hypothetical protein ACL6C3_19135 [Capilliphycus salinus ALCB114379]|uniref:hypothetical protein n=1 Tax=Capilliphycus salinus TaxID=2768948 RepID=UPI0039A478F3